MSPKEKVIDAQELARFIEKTRTGAGAYDQHEPVVKVSDLMAWLIGANNHHNHGYPIWVHAFSDLKLREPALLMFHSRDEIMLLDSESFRKAWRKYLRGEA